MLGLLAESIASSIDVNIAIKKAIICLLLGGNEKILPTGTRIRGDIHVLLIGDPGVGKSQLLKYVQHTATISVATTAGRGSSGVGLTAAVSMHQNCDRQIQAGAMILADRGVVCIDEFDKITDTDRVSIHEVMEQGRVTISKAGIHAKINARCSVLAAGNPMYGIYNQFKTPMENIGLQESLLSRFDFLFLMLDEPNITTDTLISDHIIRMHRYRDPKTEDGEAWSDADILYTLTTLECNEGETQMYEPLTEILPGNHRKLNPQFVTKYINIAKTIKPILTDTANNRISDMYLRLRSTEFGTPRLIESIIRISTAIAKARLSRTVESRDVKDAEDIFNKSYTKNLKK